MTAPSDNFIDRAIAFLSPERALRRRRARFLLSAFRGADTSRLRNNWILPGAGPDATPDAWDLSALRERSRDANRNDPVASGATDTLQTNIVGSGLKPQARIRADRLGIGEDAAETLNRQAEHAWQLFSPLADSANRLDIDEIQFLTLRKVIEDGEAILLPVWASEKWRPFGRCLEMIESDRMEDPSWLANEKITQGVEVGARSEPVAYHIRKAGSAREFVRIPARDGFGRPKVLHIFQTKRPGQLRGIPYFAPVLSYFKDLADYLEAEVVAARVAACLAVFVTKADPMASAIGLAKDADATNARVQGIEPGMVGYLNTGESINVVDPKRPGETFPAFMETVLRLIGVSLGLPYELLIKDFSKTNYSSARAALLEGRRMFLQWRSWLARKLCQPVWEMVLEEAFLKGMFDADDFYRFKPEYCRAIWIGGGWGWVDPVKEVEASRKAIDYGLSTLAEETAAQGRDWEEVLEQQKRERDRAAELGIDLEGPRGPETKGSSEKGEENA